MIKPENEICFRKSKINILQLNRFEYFCRILCYNAIFLFWLNEGWWWISNTQIKYNWFNFPENVFTNTAFGGRVCFCGCFPHPSGFALPILTCFYLCYEFIFLTLTLENQFFSVLHVPGLFFAYYCNLIIFM